MTGRRLLRTAEAASEVGWSRQAIAKWVNEGKLIPTAVSPGGQYRWDIEHLRHQLMTLNDTVVAAIVVNDERRAVLATKRQDGIPPWGFPAGKMERGESPEDCGVREVKEETGLRVIPGGIIGERDHPRTGRHMIYMSAEPAPDGEEPFVGDALELSDVQWLSWRELLLVMPDMFAPVHDYLRKRLLPPSS